MEKQIIKSINQQLKLVGETVMKNLLIKSIIIFGVIFGGFITNLSATVRTITFENKEGVAVDDLHIVFKNAATVWDNSQPHTFNSERHDANNKSHNFYGTSIPANGSATLTFNLPIGDIEITEWWWTQGGTAFVDGTRKGDIKKDSGKSTLSWAPHTATGDGVLAVSIGGVTHNFNSSAGFTTSQTIASLTSFLNTDFMMGSFYISQNNPEEILLAGNLLGDPSYELNLSIISQDSTQTLTITPTSSYIPTLSQWGLIILGAGLLAIGSVYLYRRKRIVIPV